MENELVLLSKLFELRLSILIRFIEHEARQTEVVCIFVFWNFNTLNLLYKNPHIFISIMLVML